MIKKENKKIELLNPKLDYVFKRIFGYTGNEEITFDLLNKTRRWLWKTRKKYSNIIFRLWIRKFKKYRNS